MTTITRPRPHSQDVPAHLAHLHPDLRPPVAYLPDGTYAGPAADLDAPARIGMPPTELPVELNSTACAPTPNPARPTTSSPYGVQPWVAGSALPPPEPDGAGAEDEDAIFRNPLIPGAGRETALSHTALPLRHRIYALHCQGHTISAIARQLRLDRGTVARHLHATEDLLLAEQTHDLARLRLRAVEAQHAILAAAWDALLCEELNEFDHRNDHPYAARRAQLLATAARAARTAAQLQGLFTPAALAAALRDVLPAEPREPSAARCGMPASPAVPESFAPTPSSPSAGSPLAFNATAPSSSTPPALQDYLRDSIAGHAATTTPPALQDDPANSMRALAPTTPPAAAAEAYGDAAPAADTSDASISPAATCGMPASTPTTPALDVPPPTVPRPYPGHSWPGSRRSPAAASDPLPAPGRGGGRGPTR